VERAVEKLRGCDPTIPWYVRVHELEWVTDARNLYARFGLEPVRWFDDLIRPLDEPLSVPAPEGVEIVPWDSVPSQAAREVSNASFADHWGSTPRNAEAWEHMLASHTIRTDLSFVARAGARVIGICLNAHYPGDEEATLRLDGWIALLGVLSEWRRQGVAAALISRSLDSFRREGFTHALLGVDAENPSGAVGLYRRLGFTHLSRSITHEMRVHPAGI
ncbi:MAG: GNAT family N-acetyltransferase, partial [Actinomycetota bacterium]